MWVLLENIQIFIQKSYVHFFYFLRKEFNPANLIQFHNLITSKLLKSSRQILQILPSYSEPDENLKAKFSVKFLILLLRLQVRYMHFRSLNGSFQKLWKNTDLNFRHTLYFFTSLGMHGFVNLFRDFLYQLVLFLDQLLGTRDEQCGIAVSKSIFWIVQTLFRIL